MPLVQSRIAASGSCPLSHWSAAAAEKFRTIVAAKSALQNLQSVVLMPSPRASHINMCRRLSFGFTSPHVLIPAIGRKARELSLQRIDPADISRHEVIAAALARLHPEIAARVSRGGTRAAEMDEGGKILLLLTTWRHIIGAGENHRD